MGESLITLGRASWIMAGTGISSKTFSLIDLAISSFQCQRAPSLVLEVMEATISCFDVRYYSFLLPGYLLLHTKTQYLPLNLTSPVT